MDAETIQEVATQFNLFVKWMDSITKEEELKTDFFAGVRNNLKTVEVISKTQSYMPKWTNINLFNVLRTFQNKFFGTSLTSTLTRRLEKVDIDEFMQMIYDLHKLTGRFLQGRDALTNGGEITSEPEKLLANIQWFAQIGRETVEKAAIESIPADTSQFGKTAKQLEQEVMEAMKDTELALLHAIENGCRQLIRMSQQEADQKSADENRRSAHLTARQRRRRGLPHPQSDNKRRQDQEREYQESTSESECTPSAESSGSETHDTRSDVEEEQ